MSFAPIWATLGLLLNAWSHWPKSGFPGINMFAEPEVLRVRTLSIRPNVYWGWLMALNRSKRNCRWKRSVRTRFFAIVKSMLLMRGVARMLRPELAYAPRFARMN